MFDRLTLAHDLLDCHGAPIGRQGKVVSPETIAEAAQKAPQVPRRPLAPTALGDLIEALGDPAYASLFDRPGARAAVERAIGAVRLPEALIDELEAARSEQPGRYRHGLLTAAVALRVLHTAVGESRELPDLAAAALLHDLGMRHLPVALVDRRERLEIPDAHRIAAHPLLGAYHLASLLGPHPAVTAARSHHWRCGQGYPAMASPPSRAIEAIAVASAFAALTQPRPYRSAPYDVRGAADVLVAEATVGYADGCTVRLLVHALRGGSGDPRRIRFGVVREGHAPDVNRHMPVAAPARSFV
jgi:predicted HD phosphohydrolase